MDNAQKAQKLADLLRQEAQKKIEAALQQKKQHLQQTTTIGVRG